jgi:hypothetical protein
MVPAWRFAQLAAVTRYWLWSLPTLAAEDAISNGTFGTRPALPVMETVACLACLAAYGYEVPNDGQMHVVPTRD